MAKGMIKLGFLKFSVWINKLVMTESLIKFKNSVVALLPDTRKYSLYPSITNLVFDNVLIYYLSKKVNNHLI